MLGVVIQNLCEITVLAEKAGMQRHAFLDFLNKSVMGSMFTALQDAGARRISISTSPSRRSCCARTSTSGSAPGRQYGVPMPTTSITRDMVQTLIGNGYDQDFSQLLLLQAKASGIELKSENVDVGDGLS